MAAMGIALTSATSSGSEPAVVPHLAAASSSTTKGGAADKDVKEISNYKLTMDAVRKFAQASKTMKQVEKKHSDDDQDDEDSDDSENSQSLADTEAKLASVPEARKAIEGAGLSVHEYVVITFALLQSAIAQYALEQGADPAKIAHDAGIHPANVTFYKEHKAEIDGLNAEMK
jgi:hypothetical protein